MPQAKLTTNAAVAAIPTPEQGQTITRCTELTGFAVLAGARTKTFVLERRVNGKPRRITLGRVGIISLQKARQDAQQLIGEIAGGTDPVARKHDETAGGMTLAEAWALYQGHLKAKNRSAVTLADYQSKLDCHMSDWLDLPLVKITRDVCRKRHVQIGESGGPYMANGVMRVLRAIWRRARRQHPELPEPPTMNVDFNEEKGRTAVIVDWPAWWTGVQQIVSPVRRDFYTFLAFSGCRAGETMRMEVAYVDLKSGVVKFPITKTEALEMPLSKFMVDLLRKRIEGNAEQFGKDCPWVFPSVTAKSGHLEEEKLIKSEPQLFAQHWSPHTLRHSWITLADQKVKISDIHQRALTNHKPKRAKEADAHSGYIHPDLDDLRKSQMKMTKYLLALIEPQPKPGKGRKPGNVVEFKKKAA